MGFWIFLGLAAFGATACGGPPLAQPFLLQQSQDENYDLFGGQYYLTPDDNLMLDSMAAAEGMGKLRHVETAKRNLQRLLNPALMGRLQAPLEMEKMLYLVISWLARARDSGAPPKDLLDEIFCEGKGGLTPAETTTRDVLLYNFHLAEHLGILDFPGLVKMAQGLPPSIPENDDNPQNRLAFAIPILPPDRFPQVAHELFNYELFDGPLPKAPASGLAPSQIEFAQKLITRGLLSPDALKSPSP